MPGNSATRPNALAGQEGMNRLPTVSKRALCLLAADAVMRRWVAAAPIPPIGDEALPDWSDRLAREVDHRLVIVDSLATDSAGVVTGTTRLTS